MNLYGRRMDVLSGRYFSSATDRAVSRGWNINRLQRWVEREREVHRPKKARARTLNAARLRPSATLSRDRTMETISRNRRRSRSPIIPASHEVDDRAVRPGQAAVRDARDGLELTWCGARLPKACSSARDENAKLKKLVADLSLDMEMLQDMIRRRL
jgi:hypothetical protein